MTLIIEAARAAIFLPERQLESLKPIEHEYIGGDILEQFENLRECNTIAEEHAALNAIILQCGKPIIGVKQYKKFYDSGPHDRFAPIFNNLGFPHTLRGNTLTSLLVRVDPVIRWQLVFNPEDNEASVFDSGVARHSTYPMTKQLSESGPYFEYLRDAVEETLWSKFVRTSKGMMVQSS